MTVAKRLTIYVVDHHPLLRDSLAALIRRIRPEANVQPLCSLTQLWTTSQQNAPAQLICIELNLPDFNGMSSLQFVRTNYPDVPLVVFTDKTDSKTRNQCLKKGVSLFIGKNASISRIIKLLCTLPVLSRPKVSEGISLTKGQRVLLLMIDQGLSNAQIAAELNLSINTIKVHCWRMYRRMGVTSRVQSLQYARINGWL